MDWKALAEVLHVPLNAGDQPRVIAPLESMYRAFEPILTLPNPEMEAEMMQSVYEKLPIADYSRKVLSVSAEMLAVARLGDVGWSDLGDPRRLMATRLNAASRTRG